MLVGVKRKSDPDGIILGTEFGNVEFNVVLTDVVGWNTDQKGV